MVEATPTRGLALRAATRMRVAAGPRRRAATLARALVALAVVAVVVVSLAALAPPACAAHAPGADSLRIRFELGASTDYTNELFYEDNFDSNAVFLNRKLLDSPQTLVGGVAFAQLEGTRGRRSTEFQLQNELHYGDLLQRDVLAGTLRSESSPDWLLQFTPSAEYLHDRTFDRNLEEWRTRAGVRVRRTLSDGSNFAELSASGDLLRSDGVGSEFVLDRNAARAAVAFERMPLLGPEWRLEYGFATRVFPDSGERDHFEHGVEGQLRLDLPGGRPLMLEGGAERRVTMRLAPTTRDNYWEGRAAAEADPGVGGSWSVRIRLEAEALHYDLEDSTLFFDYEVVRARVGPRLSSGGPWSVTVAPRAETLFSRLDPAEGYQELAGTVELEYLNPGSWWNATPAAGWRDYDEIPGSAGDAAFGLHSSYAFYELGLLADQTLPAGLRLRAFLNGRFEYHIDSAQDARSLYFSLDVRRLF
jgi:hypothetical protein